MRKLWRIWQGWARHFGLIKTTPAEVVLSELRLMKCRQCEFASKSRVLEIVNGHAKYSDVLKCTKCGCPCKQKSLVLTEKCPMGKWYD